MLNIIGLIPARYNSKRVLKKNIRTLGGKPLIAWTIDIAKKSKALSDIYVSTDNIEIAKIAENYGAKSPWIRSENLSNDNALTVDVVLDFIDKLETANSLPDGIMLLQPTSPFRSVKSIMDAIDIFSKDISNSVVSFTKANIHPEWCFRMHQNEIVPVTSWSEYNKRSQDIDDTYKLNGLIYLASPKFIRSNKSFLNPHTKLLLIDNEIETLDIDTEDDFLHAESIVGRF